MAETDMRTLLAAGDEQARAGNTPGAIDCYLRAADIFEERGAPLQAAALYKMVMRLDPGRVDLRPRLVAAYVALGLSVEAASEMGELDIGFGPG